MVSVMAAWRCIGSMGMRHGRIATGLGLLVLLAGVAVWRSNISPVVSTSTLQGPVVGMTLDTITRRAFIITMGAHGGTGHAIVLDTLTGKRVRTDTLGYNPSDLFIDAPANRVFVGDSIDEKLRVLDARTGALLRTVQLGYMPHGLRGGVDARTSRVFVWASGVRVLDAYSGVIRRTVLNLNDVMAIDEQDGYVFVANDVGHKVSVLDARTGAMLRTVVVSQVPSRMFFNAATRHLFASENTNLQMFDAATGRILRTIHLGPWLGYFPAITSVGTMLIAQASAQAITLVDARTGNAIGTVPVAQSFGPLIVAEWRGRVFLAASDPIANGSVWMIDEHSGAVRRTASLPAWPASVAVDERTARLFISSGGQGNSSHVTVLDARSGTLIRTLAVGGGAGLLAIDERAGRVLVVGAGGPMYVLDALSWMPQWLRSHMPFLPPPRPGTRLMPGTVTVLDESRL